MPKLGTVQKTETSDRPTARPKRNNAAPTSNPEGASPATAGAHEEIVARAYELFLARGGQHGDDWGDWFRAEAELRQE